MVSKIKDALRRSRAANGDGQHGPRKWWKGATRRVPVVPFAVATPERETDNDGGPTALAIIAARVQRRSRNQRHAWRSLRIASLLTVLLSWTDLAGREQYHPNEVVPNLTIPRLSRSKMMSRKEVLQKAGNRAWLV